MNPPIYLDHNGTTPISPEVADAMQPGERIIPVDIDKEMKRSYLAYSMSVIVSRAIPDVRDGLKPVQRRILTAMNDLNLRPGRPYRKSAKITGDTTGNYHPHGTMAVYDTLVEQAWRAARRACAGQRAREHRARHPDQGRVGPV